MDVLGTLLLEILGEIGGGRGGEINDLPRFALGMMFWGVMLVGALNARRRNALLRDKLLIAGFFVGFARDFFMLVVTILGLHDIVSADTLAFFLPPLDNMLMLVARAVIAAAFLHYIVRPSDISKSFFVFTMGISGAMYIIIAYDWLIAVKTDPGVQFGEHWSPWFIHYFGAAFLLVTIFLILRQSNRVRRVVAITFIMYFMTHILILINLYTDQRWDHVILPICNNLDLWAIPIIGFVYWREQRDQHAQLQAEIKQTERLELIGQLSAGVSHDFKNHLQVIRGYAELAHIQQAQPEKVGQCIKEISDTVDRSVALVNQLLAFSRRGNVEKDVSASLNDVVTDLTPILSQLLGPQYKLDFQLATGSPTARFDTTELEQVVVNLVVNARDAMPDGGVIKLSTRNIYSRKRKSKQDSNDSKPRDVEKVQLIISDSGVGMSQATIQRVFEPFYTTKPVGQGTGLGLSTVYGLVQRQEGKIEIESKLYEGTTVTVNFWPAKNRIGKEVNVDEIEVLGGNEHILIAEDDESVRNLVYELLTTAGYTVYQANDGYQAQELARQHRDTIELLLFDVAMPRMNGYLAYESIFPVLPNAPVAFVSADTSRAKGYQASYPHLAKPFTRSQLLSYVREQLL